MFNEYSHTYLKIKTNVRMEKANVTPMPIVRTPLDRILVHVKQATMAMDFHVQVGIVNFLKKYNENTFLN